MLRVTTAFGLAVLSATGALSGQSSQSSDSASVVATLDAFRAALANGDSLGALGYLAAGARIVESGGVESVAEYRAHHLPADILFAQTVPATRGPVSVAVMGDVAWAVSTSVSQGEFRGRPVNSAGAELAVLVRSEGTWLIHAVHWSSRARR